jgi:hypothetical protein
VRAASGTIAIIVLSIAASACGGAEPEAKGGPAKADAPKVERATPQELAQVADTQLQATKVAGLMSTCLVTDGSDDHTVCGDDSWFTQKDPSLAPMLELGDSPGGLVVNAVGPLDANVNLTTPDAVGETTEMTFTVVFSTDDAGSLDSQHTCTPDYRDICLDGRWNQYGGSALDIKDE